MLQAAEITNTSVSSRAEIPFDQAVATVDQVRKLQREENVMRSVRESQRAP
jgi:hypothetical protein